MQIGSMMQTVEHRGDGLDPRAHDKLTDEVGRVAALHRYQVLDTQPEAAFERLTSLVRSVFGVPISAVSLIDADRQWFKSVQGLPIVETPREVAFCAHTIMTHEPMVVADATLDARFAANPLVTGATGIRSYVGVPLASPDGYNLGSLCAIDTRPRAFSDEQIAQLSSFGALVVAELELRTLAHRDALTGSLNRRAFVEGATCEINRLVRYGHPTSLIVFDIDHFKQVNDTFGHPGGDEILRSVTRACGESLRDIDFLGRVGGEEFAVCLPQTDLAQAMICAERLRTAIAAAKATDRELPQVTASFGVAQVGATETYGEWFARADRAMYLAKRNGRNRCQADDCPPPIELAA